MRIKSILALLLALALCLSLMPAALAEDAGTIAPVEEPEGVTPPGEPVTLNYGYYLIGRYGWTINDLDESRDKFTQNYAASTEEYTLITELEEGQEIKVVLVSNGTQLAPWYPEGDNYVVKAADAGRKIIYFRPGGNGDWGDFGGYMYITDPPTYHVNFNQPAHGMLIADKYEAQEGETVNITAVPDSGYYPNFIRSSSYPPNFVNSDAFHASFTMPAYDVTVNMYSNSFSAAPGYYFSSGKNVSEIGPNDKFQERETSWGDLFYQAELVEGNYLSLTRIIVENENGWPSNGYSNSNPEITADMAGRARLYLSRTEREGYTKVFDELTYVANTEDMWLLVKYPDTITIAPTENGTVTGPADAFEGDGVAMTVTPAEGIMLDTFTVTDANGDPVETAGTSFTMPGGPVTVTATFKQAVNYGVTLLGVGDGVTARVTVNGTTVTGDAITAKEGDNVDFNITTDANHRFLSISAVDEEGNELTLSKRPDGANKYRLVMPASNVTVTVDSKAIYPLYLVNTQVDSLNLDDILGDGTASYDPATRTLSFSSAEPNFGDGYGSALIYWTGEDSLTVQGPEGQALHLAGNATYCAYATSGDLIFNGDVLLDIPSDANGVWCMKNLTFNGNVSGTVSAIALYGYVSLTVNGDVNVTNTDSIRTAFSNGSVLITGDFTGNGYSIDARGGITVGGNVTIDSSTTAANYGLQSAAGAVSVGGDFLFKGKASYAVYADLGFTCGGSVTVVNTSGQGIVAPDGAITVVSGVWDVLAASNPLYALNGIDIPDTHEITEPEGGKASQLNGFWIITGADGETPATHAVISIKKPDGPVTVLGKSLTLNGKLELNFYLDLPALLLADPHAYVSINGEKLLVKDAELCEVRGGQTGYRFTSKVKFAQLTEDRVLRVYTGADELLALQDLEGNDLTETGLVYSGQDYIEYIRENSEDAGLLSVVNALSDLGSLAQAQFNYNTDARVDVVGALDAVTAEDLAAYAPTVTAESGADVYYYGSSLLLQDITTLRHYFRVKTGDIADYTFTVDGTAVTPVQKGGYYYIDIINIAARDLDKSFHVEVTGAEGLVISLDFSALGYACRQLDTGETGIPTDLAKAVYLYGTAADAIFPD